MTSTALRSVIQHLHRLVGVGPAGGLADADLLQRFLSQRDEAAFEVLIWRHGPMVWNVCQRLLHHQHDAEDAFQATFLAFMRKAGSIRRPNSLSSWLYKVAYRVALRARVKAAQQARHETYDVDVLPAKAARPESCWHNLAPVLDDEVSRLPLKYRLPFVLCYLEGKTTDEAAQELGCPRGTVATRLAWARERLRGRLTRRGLAFSTAVLATSLSQNAASATLPAALVHVTVRSGWLFMAGNAAGAITVPVAALADGVLKAMALTKVKIAIALFFAVSVLAAGAGLAVHHVAQSPEVNPQERLQGASREGTQPKRDKPAQGRTDRYGDPLPEGAIARIGTTRLRTNGSINVIAFSRNGRQMAYGNENGYVYVCEAADGKPLVDVRPDETHFHPITELAFSPDGQTLAASGYLVRGRLALGCHHREGPARASEHG